MTKPLSEMSRSELVDACIKEQQRSADLAAEADEWEELAYRFQGERNALEAHVERLREGLSQALIHWGAHCTDEDGIAYAECERRCDETPTTSLTRIKAEWLKDIKQQSRRVRNYSAPDQVFEAIPLIAIDCELRRRAEGGE